MSNNTRNLRNRSSRFSSPATFTSVGQEGQAPVQDTNSHPQTADSGSDGQSQTKAEQGPWIEPVVRNGVASFEDTKGLERVGVLEHMQPLGAAPNPKLLQRLKVNLGNRASLGSARATPVFSEGVGSPASQPAELVRNELQSPIIIDPELLNTPSPPILQDHPELQSHSPFQNQSAPLPPPPAASSQIQPGTQPPSPSVPLPPTTPEVFTNPLSYRGTSTITFPSLSRPDNMSLPQPQQPAPQVIMSPPRGRPAKKEVEEMKVYNPDDSMMSPAMASIMRPSRASHRYSSSSFSDTTRGDRFRASLQNAIDRAIADGKPEIEAGLRKVLDESGRDELTTALDNISKYKANVPVNQFKVFKHFVKKGIRKHRRTASHLSLSSNNDQGPSPPPSQPAAYISTFRTKPPTSPTMEDNMEHHTRSPLILRSTQLGLIKDNSPTKSTHQPVKVIEDADVDVPMDQPRKATPRKRRSSSTSSLSSLSSTNLSDYAPPEMAIPVKDQPIEGRPARLAAQRQGSNRILPGNGRPTRSSATGTDVNSHSDSSTQQPVPNYNGIDSLSTHKSKKQKLTHVEPANEEVARQKANLESNIVRDTDYEWTKIRTPSPERRLKNEAENEARRKRGLSPRPPRQREGPPPPVIHPEALSHSNNIEPSSPVSAQGDRIPVNGTGRKRDYDEFDKDDHSDQLSSLGPTPPPPARVPVNTRLSVGAPSTRSSTPRVAKETRPTRTRRTKIMDTSPQKPKDSAVTAGVPGDARAGIDQDSAVANGNGLEKTSEDSRHGEECRACGDVGILLCCDGEGCLNSFHGECLEPPVDPEDPSLELWYCPECVNRQKSDEVQVDNQLMGALINYAQNASPRTYVLPLEVRNYFENVKTGDDGEYVETAPPPTNKKGAPKADHHGALKAPNFKELKDAKGNTRFCYKCNGTAENGRDIIPCDYCPHEWHLDCITPPLATVPKRFDASGKVPQHWRCPLHVEYELRNVSQAQHAVPGQMGRIPRLRYPRKRVGVTPKEFFAQNPTNNGLIEPVLEPEQTELDLKTVEMNGQIFKIPEHKIKLDFIAKARREFYIDHAIPQVQGRRPTKFHDKTWTPDHSRVPNRQAQYDTMDYEMSNIQQVVFVDPMVQARADAELRLQQKSFIEQQTVLALLDLVEPIAQLNGTTGNPDDRASVGTLLHRLVADVPEDVAEQIVLSEEQQLEKLMEVAQKRMKILKSRTKPVQTDSRMDVDTDHRSQNKAAKPTLNGKMSGSMQQTYINGMTLGHDHGED